MQTTQGAEIPSFRFPYTSGGYGGQNGRVNLASQHRLGAEGDSVPQSAGFGFQTRAEKGFSHDMLRGNLEESPVSLVFFSPENVVRIQDAIRRGVYEKSGARKYVIDNQDVDEIKIIMRSMFLTYARNNQFDISSQVAELNQYVIEWAVPRILSEIDHYIYYLNDITHLPVPLTQPQSMSSAGTRSLPFQQLM
jgi:hypothetical protein